MKEAIDITTEQRKTLLALLRRFIPGVVVWAYGSRVKWTARINSDLDLVVFATPVQRSMVSELKEALAESDLPFLVDLHIWEDVPERFHEIIRKEYVVVQEVEKGMTYCSVGDVAAPTRNALVGGPFGSDLVSRDYVPNGVPVIRGTNMGHGRWVDGEFVYVTPEKADSLASNCAKPGDLVFTQRGTLGQVALVPKKGTDRYLISQSQMKLTVDAKKSDALFLYYVFTSAEQQAYIRQNAIQTGVPHTNLGILRNTPLSLPPLAEQKTIAAVLGALDDKIELNRRMNATLEAMARALFQSWFVDFDPVRAKLDGRRPVGIDPTTAALFPKHFEHGEHDMFPVGWRLATIEEISAINAWTLGKSDDLETLEYVEISEVSRGNIANIAIYPRGEEPSRARRRLRHGDTVLSTVRPDRGSYFLALNPPENRVASTGFAVLTPTKVPWSFIHAALTQPEVSDHLGQMADGGAYPAVRPEIIGAIEVALPNEPKILDAFHRACAPLFEQAEANRTQSRTLAALRNSLLPKMLSGELSTASFEKEISA